MNYSTTYRYGLTHWGRDETDNTSQTTFSNVLSSMKMFEFRLKFRFCLFLRVELTSPTLVQIMAWHLPGAKPLSESMIVYRRVYASLSLNEKAEWKLNVLLLIINGTHFAITIANVSTVTSKNSLHYTKHTYQLLFWNHTLKIWPKYWRQVVHPQTKSVAKPGTLLLVILSLVFYYFLWHLQWNTIGGIEGYGFIIYVFLPTQPTLQAI